MFFRLEVFREGIIRFKEIVCLLEGGLLEIEISLRR